MQAHSRKALRRPAAGINVTPLVDVLLILLVLLLLAMPLQVKRLPVDLPRTALGGTPTPQQTLPLSLGADGQIYLATAPVSLPEALKKVTATSTVELSIDKDVRYERIAQTISAIQARNPKDIVLITR